MPRTRILWAKFDLLERHLASGCCMVECGSVCLSRGVDLSQNSMARLMS
jgi:hypothetical protein